MIKENLNDLKDWKYSIMRGEVKYIRQISSESLESYLKDVDLILSTRLKDETYRGIINFEKAIFLKTPIDEIQKAMVGLTNISQTNLYPH